MAEISGVWLFNETLTRSGTRASVSVNFKSNGADYSGMNYAGSSNMWVVSYTPPEPYGVVGYYNGKGWCTNSADYKTFTVVPELRTVDFGNTPQEVDDAFYTWFTNRATKQETHAHTHSYTETVTTPATCTTPGIKTYTCAECGESYTEAIPMTAHSYVNGVCTVCGAINPEGAELYRIQREDLEAIGDQVRRLCALEETDTMGPVRMAQELENLNIELEEVYVSATTEEQVITPSEGYYGISKVIVEAVDDDHGGGEGGEGDEIIDAGDVSFGDEYTETGRFDYGDSPDGTENVFSEIPAGAYQLILRAGLKPRYVHYINLNGVQYLYEADEPIYVYFAHGQYRKQTDNSVTNGWRLCVASNAYTVYHTNLSTGQKSSFACNGETALHRGWEERPQISGAPYYEVGLHQYEGYMMNAMAEIGNSALSGGGTSSEQDSIFLIVSDSQLYSDGTNITNADGSVYTVYKYDYDTDTWEVFEETSGPYSIGSMEIVWTSHPISDSTTGETAINGSNPPKADTESSPGAYDDEYIISGESVNSLIAAAQKITGTTDRMTVEEATRVLEEYYASLNGKT